MNGNILEDKVYIVLIQIYKVQQNILIQLLVKFQIIIYLFIIVINHVF